MSIDLWRSLAEQNEISLYHPLPNPLKITLFAHERKILEDQGILMWFTNRAGRPYFGESQVPRWSETLVELSGAAMILNYLFYIFIIFIYYQYII